MKILATLALLLVMGCQSKPTDSKYYDSAYGKKLDLQIENLNCPIGAALQYDIISGRFGCEQIGTFHATTAQWEAAQGLYVIYLCTDQDVPFGLKDCYPTEEFPSGHSILNPFPVNDSTPTLFLRPDGKRMTYGELRKWAKQSPPSGDAK